jgi:hypothetical protein
MRDLDIRVERNFPPIRDRSCDWSAWVNGQEETTTCTAATAPEALFALAERIEETVIIPPISLLPFECSRTDQHL